VTPFSSDKGRRAAFAKGGHAEDTPKRTPLFNRTPAAREPGVVERAVERTANRFLDYLPEEINSLGIVHMGLFKDAVADALQDLQHEGELDDMGAFVEQHRKALEHGVVQELRRRGIRVVGCAEDMMRMLAKTKRLEERHLPGFKDVIEDHDAPDDEAGHAGLLRREVYTVKPDGTVVYGMHRPGRLLVVRLG
jgi:hypothetical protein